MPRTRDTGLPRVPNAPLPGPLGLPKIGPGPGPTIPNAPGGDEVSTLFASFTSGRIQANVLVDGLKRMATGRGGVLQLLEDAGTPQSVGPLPSTQPQLDARHQRISELLQTYGIPKEQADILAPQLNPLSDDERAGLDAHAQSLGYESYQSVVDAQAAQESAAASTIPNEPTPGYDSGGGGGGVSAPSIGGWSYEGKVATRLSVPDEPAPLYYPDPTPPPPGPTSPDAVIAEIKSRYLNKEYGFGSSAVANAKADIYKAHTSAGFSSTDASSRADAILNSWPTITVSSNVVPPKTPDKTPDKAPAAPAPDLSVAVAAIKRSFTNGTKTPAETRTALNKHFKSQILGPDKKPAKTITPEQQDALDFTVSSLIDDWMEEKEAAATAKADAAAAKADAEKAAKEIKDVEILDAASKRSLDNLAALARQRYLDDRELKLFEDELADANALYERDHQTNLKGIEAAWRADDREELKRQFDKQQELAEKRYDLELKQHDLEKNRFLFTQEVGIGGLTGKFRGQDTVEKGRFGIESRRAAFEEEAATAGLTGNFRGSPTLQKQQFAEQNTLARATLTGVLDKFPTLQGQEFAFTKAFREAEATGILKIDGRPPVETLALRRQAFVQDVETRRLKLDTDRLDLDRQVGQGQLRLAETKALFDAAIQRGNLQEAVAARRDRKEIDLRQQDLQKRQLQTQTLLAMSNPATLLFAKRSGLLVQLEAAMGIDLGIPDVPEMLETGSSFPSSQELTRASPIERQMMLAEAMARSGLPIEDIMAAIEAGRPGSGGRPMQIGGR